MSEGSFPLVMILQGVSHARARTSLDYEYERRARRLGISCRCIHGASTVRTARLIEATSRRATIGPINLPRVATRGAAPQ